MMKKKAKELSEIYRIFSNEKRLLIFWLLLEGEMPVNGISGAIDSSVQNTSQHLRLMKANSILDTRRNGKEIYYRIADTEIGQLCRLIHQETIKNYKA